MSEKGSAGFTLKNLGSNSYISGTSGKTFSFGGGSGHGGFGGGLPKSSSSSWSSSSFSSPRYRGRSSFSPSPSSSYSTSYSPTISTSYYWPDRTSSRNYSQYPSYSKSGRKAEDDDEALWVLLFLVVSIALIFLGYWLYKSVTRKVKEAKESRKAAKREARLEREIVEPCPPAFFSPTAPNSV